MSLNLQNLKIPTSEEARRNGAKGGSSPKRRATLDAKKLMKSILSSSPVITDKTLKSLRNHGVNVDDENLTTNAAVIQAVIASKAMNGDLEAAKMVFEMAGFTVTAKDQNEREKVSVERRKLKLIEQGQYQKKEMPVLIDTRPPEPEPEPPAPESGEDP